ncbi:MAG: sulfite exporter TauE/SafE family protein [Pseudomonadota bacterium]
MDFLSNDLIWLALALFATGIIAGVLSGLLGVGGGIVIVPVLFHIFTSLEIDPAVRMHLAVGTSLATIIFTSIRSVRSHHKRGAVDVPLLKSWWFPVLLGVLGGTLIAGVVSGPVLTAVFAIVAFIVAMHMAFGRESWQLGEQLPTGIGRYFIASGIGGFSVLMGLGGGTLGVPIMRLFNYPIHNAVATASGLGVLIAIPGMIGFIIAGWQAANLPPYSVGYVNLIGFALIVPATVISAPWGVRLAHAISRQALQYAFALFLALTSIRMLLNLF